MLVLSLFVIVAISTLKAESAKCRAHNFKLEEFIPLKKECLQKDEENKKEKGFSDKNDWMSSVQLWNTVTTVSNDYNSRSHDIKQLEIEVTIIKMKCVYLFYRVLKA